MKHRAGWGWENPCFNGGMRLLVSPRLDQMLFGRRAMSVCAEKRSQGDERPRLSDAKPLRPPPLRVSAFKEAKTKNPIGIIAKTRRRGTRRAPALPRPISAARSNGKARRLTNT